MSIDKNTLNKLLKDFDQSVVNELIDKGYVTGYSAWRLYDFLKKYSKRLVHEDEELDERECYIAILELVTEQYFLILKTNSDIYGYVIDKLDRDFINELMIKYRECIKKQ